jgi:HEAT repeat protein
MKMETYLQDLDSYEEEIVALAEAALTALIEKLDRDDGWRAARLLGRIGRSTPAVLKALRRQVQEAREPAAWCARVLESLGDTEYLFRLASQEASQKAALSGLVFTYTSWASSLGWPNRRELDYRPLERILESKRPAWTRAVEEQLRPGSSFVTIQANEVDEAIRGLQSPHVIIRQHATCILGSRELGVAAGKKILPALVERLDDPHPNVRRLAALNLSYWKAAAKPYFPNIRRLLKDPNPDVRAEARSLIRQRLLR